ncbi:MAG: ZIP family metal transporter [bacterium]|nr:MAG: ZIP family metal transporter [bacterium]
MEILQLLLLALLGSVIALLGGVVFLYNRKLSSVLEKHAVPFAAGVLVTVALVGLIPEAEHQVGESAFWIVLVSFLAVYVFEHLFFGIHHHGEDDGHGHKIKESSTGLVIFGDTIHNFIDGVAIGAGFLIEPSLGLLIAFSTFLHEVPHEIGDFGILLKAGWKKSKILVVNILSSLTTVVGAFVVYFFSHSETLNGTLMAISAGVFLYLGASDFLPKVNVDGKNKFKAILPLLLGASIIMATIVFLPHEH